jgi:Flp pilus assembly protein TadD
LQQAVAALQSGRPADARRYGERALQLSPGNAACHLVLATAHQNMDRPGDAERHYTECLRLDPTNVRALTNLGMLLINADRGEEAAAHLECAVEAAPGALDARHYLARAYGMCRRYKDSVAQFRIVQCSRAWPGR